MALTGEFKELSFADIIQTYCITNQTVRIMTTYKDDKKGSFFIEGGQIVDAHLGMIRGTDAFYQALRQKDGRFQIDLNILTDQQTISMDWKNLLFEGMRLLDEYENGKDTFDLAALMSQDEAVKNSNGFSAVRQMLSAPVTSGGAAQHAVGMDLNIIGVEYDGVQTETDEVSVSETSAPDEIISNEDSNEETAPDPLDAQDLIDEAAVTSFDSIVIDSAETNPVEELTEVAETSVPEVIEGEITEVVETLLVEAAVTPSVEVIEIQSAEALETSAPQMLEAGVREMADDFSTAVEATVEPIEITAPTEQPAVEISPELLSEAPSTVVEPTNLSEEISLETAVTEVTAEIETAEPETFASEPEIQAVPVEVQPEIVAVIEEPSVEVIAAPEAAPVVEIQPEITEETTAVPMQMPAENNPAVELPSMAVQTAETVVTEIPVQVQEPVIQIQEQQVSTAPLVNQTAPQPISANSYNVQPEVVSGTDMEHDLLLRELVSTGVVQSGVVVDEEGSILCEIGSGGENIAKLAFLIQGLEAVVLPGFELGEFQGATLEIDSQALMITRSHNLSCAFFRPTRVPKVRAFDEVNKAFNRVFSINQ